MRIVSGKFRGKLIHNPIHKTTRPLKDMVRESIFNILEHSRNEKIDLKGKEMNIKFDNTNIIDEDIIPNNFSVQIYDQETDQKFLKKLPVAEHLRLFRIQMPEKLR